LASFFQNRKKASVNAKKYQRCAARVGCQGFDKGVALCLELPNGKVDGQVEMRDHTAWGARSWPHNYK